TPMTVRFKTVPEDYPPNISDLEIEHIMLYFSGSGTSQFDVPVRYFRFSERDGSGPVGGAARSNDRIISTRRGNAGSWLAMQGKTPVGEWELSLPNTEEVR